MKNNFTFMLMWLLCVFSINTSAQTQFWSDTFEDSGAPSSGTRTPSSQFSCGSPAIAYFDRKDGSNMTLLGAYSGIQGAKFWAGEDQDQGPTCTNASQSANQTITWSSINIAGKSGLSFKGNFAAGNTIATWEGPFFGVNQDYIVLEYSIDGGAWTKAIAFYSTSASNVPSSTLNLETTGDLVGDGTALSYTLTEFTANIPGTGSQLDLRLNTLSNGSGNEEYAVDDFRLFETPACTPPTVTANPPNRAICAESNTTFPCSATGATAYQWQVNTGSGFTDITNGFPYSGATTATLTVTGAPTFMNGYMYRCRVINGLSTCFTNTNSSTLSVSNVVASQSQYNVSCFGGSNGSAIINPNGGISPYTYSWSPSGGTGATASGLSAGSYTVTITDAIGCTATRNYTITQPTALNGSTVVTNVACNGGTNGAINLTPSGGTPGYTFDWGGGITTEDRTGLAAGTYSVTITDANGCTKVVSGITVTQPTTAVSGTTVVTNVACNGGTNGAINLTPTGGTGPYTFNWLPSGPTTEDRTGLAAGSYSVQITDANGCTGTVSGITLTQPTAISLTPASQTNVACNGGATGAASVNTPTGGAGGYTYNWTPGNPTGDGTTSVTGLTAGTWTCTVTDANGCTAVQNFTVTQPTAISLTPASQTNVACNGGATGAASVNTPTGGAGGYTYNWTPGTPTGDGTTSVTGLTAGTWTCTVTDANGCTAVQNFTVTQPTAISLTPASQTNISCFGGSNGAASVNTPTGGAGGYTYNWTPGNPTGDGTTSVTGLTAGTWTCTVTDANGCTAVQNFTVTQPTAISLTPASQTNVACNGGATGAASVNTPTGGAGGYTYNWTPGTPTGDGTRSVTGLTAGTWTCTVTDANGCTAAQNFTVTQPTAISLTPASQTNVACNGGATGAASVNTPTGGAGGYTYNWTPGTPTGDGTTSVTGLTAGTWTCTVTDANGCTAVQNFTVTQPTAISLTPASQTNVACNGGATGAASVNTPTGGAGGYTYNWTPGTPTGDGTTSVTGLTAGTWTCTVTDANGCTAAQNFTVTQPTAISLTPASQTNVACNGGATGAASVNTPTGGAGGYTYNWTPGTPTGDGTTSVTGLTAGTWTCTVTDANGCTAAQNFTVTQPTAISLTPASQTNVACNGGATGAASVNTPTGGAGGYTYNWTPGTPTGDGTTSVTGLTAGTWTCTVTDANGCTAVQNFTVTQPTAISLTPASQTNISCFGGSNGAASVNTPTGGAGGYTYNWTPGNPTGDGTTSVTGLTAGTWTCTVTDANGCTAVQNFTVTQPTAISLTPASQTNVACNGGATGAASVNTPTGGAGGYTYNWTPGTPTGDGTTSVTGLTAGTWTCTVTDANGCTAAQNFTVTQPTAISLTPASQTNVACNGGATGAASVNTPTGGAGGYTYNWTPGTPTGDGTTSVTGLTAGTWTCTVTDANGCTAAQNFTVTQPTAISLTPASQTNVACNGGATGAASVNTPTGGAGGYTYNWTPGTPTGDGTRSVTGLAAGTWTCTVTDANGCTAVQNFTVTQPTAISLTATSQTNVSCNGGSNGTATVTTTGGTPSYTYSWSPSGGTAATATGLAAGTYTVTVTDANSCQTTQSFTITEPSALVVTAESQTNVSCNGGSNGSATVSVSGGTSGYTYSWAPSGGTAATATGLAAGTYTVTVTDANSCQTTQSFTITEPSALVATAESQTNVSCNGGSNGSATVSVTGGTSGYTYSWAPLGGTAATATGLSAGNYIVTVTDTNGCIATETFTITQPTALAATASSQTNVSCNGGSNGSATVSVFGGTSGYTYSWSPSGGTVATATGLSAGTYTVTVTDANGCQIPQSFTITEPTAISFTTTSLPGYDHNSSYSQTITSTGGTGSITYSVAAGSLPNGFNLSSTGIISGTSTQVADSNFTVTATDTNGCSATYDFTLRLNQIPITVTATASQTKVYGESDPVLTYTVTPDLLTGDSFTGTLARAAGENIGSYTINQGTLSAGDKYLISYVSNDFAITAKPITVTADAAQTKVYGTANPVYTYSFSPALVSGDTFTGALTRAAGENVGSYAITQGTLNAGANYTISYVSKDFAITAKPITVTADAAQTKVYGTANPVYTYSVSPALVSGDTFTGALTRAAGENIGTYAITQGTLSAGANYTISYVSTDFAITAKPITVTADAAQTKVYGENDPTFTYSVSPALVSGDTFTGALTRAAGENIGTYAITQGTLSAGANYTISYVSKDFAITAKAITVTADASQTKVYGENDPTFTYSVSPALVSGDTFTGALTRAAGENIGTYAITQGTLSAGTNYTISYVSKDFAITAKPITVTADASQTKVYGENDPTFTYSVSPALVSGDTFTGALARAAGENIGTYAITQGTLSAGANYTISYVSTDFAITAKPITVTADAAQTKVYGENDPTFTYSVSPALVNGDTFTGALTRAAGENVGSYAITQGTLNAGVNYIITYTGASFSITKADQIITWNQSLGLGCDGETSLVLTAVSNSGLAVNYTSSNTNVATISNGLVNFQNYGSATITASQEGNINYNAAPEVVLPVVNSQPNLIRKQFEDIIFFDNSSNNFMSYSWYKNGVLVAGQTSQFFKENGALNGTYYAIATKLDGTLITTCPLTLSPTIEEEYIKIAPNPVRSNGNFQLITNVNSSRLQNARIELYSVTGNMLININTSQNTVDLKAPMVEGIYVVKMTLTNGKYFTKNLLVKN